MTLPQIRGMYNGDRARKLTLVEYGFRLPSALDNRPLVFDEFLALTPRAIDVSATPGELELELSQGAVVEQIIRPTGLIDPEIEVRPVRGQVDDLLHEIRIRERAGERVLVTTLTKRMAEDLTDYLQQVGVRVRYMHSDIDAIERMEIVRGLRLGEFDVLVGINLLREGLDLPEVSLVAILDADQEGFLRSDRSLIQTVGRAARHVERAGDLLRGPDHGLDAARDGRDLPAAHACSARTISSTASRPRSVIKSVDQVRFITRVADARTDHEAAKAARRSPAEVAAAGDRDATIARLEKEMQEAAAALDFETAARLRDALFEIRASTPGGGGQRAGDTAGSGGGMRRRVASGAPRN